jgi:hypothetical protein
MDCGSRLPLLGRARFAPGKPACRLAPQPVRIIHFREDLTTDGRGWRDAFYPCLSASIRGSIPSLAAGRDGFSAVNFIPASQFKLSAATVSPGQTQSNQSLFSDEMRHNDTPEHGLFTVHHSFQSSPIQPPNRA